MKFIKTELEGVYIVEPRVFGDSRGFFMESYSEREFFKAGLRYDFVQDNHSLSEKKGTLRGIHFQKGEKAQAKLVRCTRGAILDIAVDLRKESPTYKKYIAAELSAENKRQLLIPRGFGHAFLSLCDNTEVQYKADNFYFPEADGSVLWCDPDIGIDWGDVSPVLSEKDKNAPRLKDADIFFKERIR